MTPRPSPRTALLPLISLGLVALFVGGREARAQQSCTTAECHAKIVAGKKVHDATEDCSVCHKSVATPHPQKGKKTFALNEPMPLLCTTCHDEVGKKANVHPPVKDGDCTVCHDPHSSAQPKLLVDGMKELCGTCHDKVVAFPNMHGPVETGDCTACHAPHDSANKKLLLKSGDDVCFGCHAEISALLKKKDVHPALEQGCTSCHNPHGSAHKKLLADAGSDLCFTCHDDIQSKVERSPVGHPPAKEEDGCPTCHSPHASDNDKLLLEPMKETCLGCHDAVITKRMTVLHGPVAEGKCTACHEPHGGQNGKLLVKEFPATAYVPYTDTAFPLCFKCHKRDMVQYPETSFATEFRDGERNLHYVHVHKDDKGRSCKLCHEIHGSPNPKLIADMVPFGKWSLPLKFVKTETGGGCSPGCHKPQYYDRKTPGKKPEAPAKAEPKKAS